MNVNSTTYLGELDPEVLCQGYTEKCVEPVLKKGVRIIMMNGPPFSGKSLAASVTARWLGCPIVSLQAILEGLLLERSDKITTILISTAFRILSRQASHLTTLALDQDHCCIVLDFPLCLRNQTQLQELFTSLVITDHQQQQQQQRVIGRSTSGTGSSSVGGVRVLIIECKPRDQIKWQQKFEMQRSTWVEPNSTDHSSNKRCDHRSTTWSKMEKVIQHYHHHHQQQHKHNIDDIVITTTYDHVSFISKLEIDPLNDLTPEVAFTRQTRQSGRVSPPSYFHEALEYLLFTRTTNTSSSTITTDTSPEIHDDKYYLSINMREWGKIRSEILHPESVSAAADGHSLSSREVSGSCLKFRVDHNIIYKPQGLSYYAECGVCEQPLLPGSPAYSCTSCELDLHDTCAELRDRTNKDSFIPPINFLVTMQYISSDLPRCKPCNNNMISYNNSSLLSTYNVDCRSCLYEVNLKYRLCPTIIRHPAHPYGFFHIQILLPSHQDHAAAAGLTCSACGFPTVGDVHYICTHCNLNYGFCCLTRLPLFITCDHVGHKQHPMELKPEPHEVLDYCICHLCWQERNPNHWYYYCRECEFCAHVYCIESNSLHYIYH